MKDPVHKEIERWAELANAVEAAARARRVFPRGGIADLTSVELQVLAAIAVWPHLTPSQVAESLAMERNSVSKPLQELEAKGFIVSERDLEDGRTRTLALTPAGAERLSDFSKGLDQFDA